MIFIKKVLINFDDDVVKTRNKSQFLFVIYNIGFFFIFDAI